MANIRVLNGQETIDALPELCDVLAECVNGGASVGFMLPFSPQHAEPFWRSVAENVGEGGTIHVVAEVDGRVVGTVQVGLASKPNQPHRGDLMKLLVHPKARGLGLARKLMEKVEQEAAARGMAVPFWCWIRRQAVMPRRSIPALAGSASGSFPTTPCFLMGVIAAQPCFTSASASTLLGAYCPGFSVRLKAATIIFSNSA